MYITEQIRILCIIRVDAYIFIMEGGKEEVDIVTLSLSLSVSLTHELTTKLEKDRNAFVSFILSN